MKNIVSKTPSSEVRTEIDLEDESQSFLRWFHSRDDTKVELRTHSFYDEDSQTTSNRLK